MKNTFCIFVLVLSFLLPNQKILAQGPAIRVDLNIPNRQESEVNEPGYTPWPLQGGGEALEVEGITFRLTGNYQSDWYKAGVQAPYYARLANDGLRTPDSITLTIGGLPAGTHSLQSYHNATPNPATNSFPAIDLFLNGVQVADSLEQSVRVTANNLATRTYLVFEALEGEDVVLTIRPDTAGEASLRVAFLNGFELNTPHAEKQAFYPFPPDSDMHTDADTGSLSLRWQGAPSALSHDVYFGTSFRALAEATTDSACFRGNQSDTSFLAKELYSMQDYYWRIDEHDARGLITRGNIWHFRPRKDAFPGAEGHGRYAIGGRGGRVVEVTNLNDAGPGSFREAITADTGPRTIVFRVSGIIRLESRLTLTDDFVTVAGQTAPGKGICIRSATFGLSGASDAIVRHMRVRIGAGTTYDGMGMAGSTHSILDHCSISWSIEEGFSSRNAKYITLQRTMIAEALNVAGHSNYGEGAAHGFAASISGDVGSFHHNLLAHCAGRNWSLAGGLDGNNRFAGRLDIFNNVVYNWHYRVTDGGAHEVNFVNNFYKPGPAWDRITRYALKAEYEDFAGTQRYYFKGNVMSGVFDETTQESGRRYTGTPKGYSPWVAEPFFPSQATIHPAREAYKQVLSDVGATQPVFDDHDIRVIRETIDSSFTYRGSYTNLAGLPDHQGDVGGYEDYPEMLRDSTWDSDHDGMPDWWELSLGLNPASAEGDFSESNADPDGDGYTQLEDYLQWMGAPHVFVGPGQTVDISLPPLFRGYRLQPAFTLLSSVNGSGEIVNDSLLRFTPAGEGPGSLEVMVRDAEGDSLVRSIGIFCGLTPADSVIETAPADTTGLPTPGDSGQDFSCYPNPAGETLCLRGDFNTPGPYDIRIMGLDGQTAHHITKAASGTFRTPGELRLALPPLPPGLYLLSFDNGGKRVYLKFIKQ